MSLTPVPDLDELAAHPERVKDLAPKVARNLLPSVIGLQTALLTQAFASNGTGEGEAPAEDRLLKVEEAAQKLGISKDQLYRKLFPFTVRVGPRQLRFSERGIEKFIRERRGR